MDMSIPEMLLYIHVVGVKTVSSCYVGSACMWEDNRSKWNIAEVRLA